MWRKNTKQTNPNSSQAQVIKYVVTRTVNQGAVRYNQAQSSFFMTFDKGQIDNRHPSQTNGIMVVRKYCSLMYWCEQTRKYMGM